MQVQFKYPKTQHILGSRECDVGVFPKKFEHLYPPLDSLKEEGSIIIEEKMDGMGIGIFFKDGVAYVQFRNDVFTSHDCPKNFKNIFNWINPELESFLENKIVFGEWMEYKHCVYYDALPSYFIEYDMFDLNREVFLDTHTRKNMLTQYNFNSFSKITSAHVIHQNGIKHASELVKLLTIKQAFGKSVLCESRFLQEHAALKNETLYDNYPEGFYIKTEKDGLVVGRYKFIRKSFLEKIKDKHWEQQKVVKNRLA